MSSHSQITFEIKLGEKKTEGKIIIVISSNNIVIKLLEKQIKPFLYCMENGHAKEFKRQNKS